MPPIAQTPTVPDTAVMPSGPAAWRKAAKLAALVLVARAVLGMSLMSIAGCIIPTPLEQQPANTNHPPKILSDEVTPPFVPAFSHSQSDVFSFTVVANDQDSGDVLTARLLYTRSLMMRNQLGVPGDIPLMSAPSTEFPGRQTATFGPRAWCMTFAVNSGGTALVTVGVSDHGFIGSPDDDQTPSDVSDLAEGTWVLTCTD